VIGLTAQRSVVPATVAVRVRAARRRLVNLRNVKNIILTNVKVVRGRGAVCAWRVRVRGVRACTWVYSKYKG
jgi:hypothetical protein